jgi:hypothetical protein
MIPITRRRQPLKFTNHLSVVGVSASGLLDRVYFAEFDRAALKYLHH